ncbi:MAG: GxxExxY protein [Verrucomicrobiota bacterium]|jgi:GxxExxY protein
MEEQELTKTIIGCAMKVHSALGPGFLESGYQKALAHELSKAGLKVECEKPLTVNYDGVVVGEFSADMLVGEKIIVELKAGLALAAAHAVQLVNYLTATGVELGLLLNFGAQRLEFKRKTRTYHPKQPPKDFIL